MTKPKFVTIDLDPDYYDRLTAVTGRLARDEELTHKVNKLMGELLFFSWVDPNRPTSEHRYAYLTEEKGHAARIKQIGEELNKLGGFSLMQYTVEFIKHMMKGPSDTRTLDMAWDGIGKWLA